MKTTEQSFDDDFTSQSPLEDLEKPLVVSKADSNIDNRDPFGAVPFQPPKVGGEVKRQGAQRRVLPKAPQTFQQTSL